MSLFEFAEFLRFDESLNFLSTRLALPEPWDYSDPEKEFNEGNLKSHPKCTDRSGSVVAQWRGK